MSADQMQLQNSLQQLADLDPEQQAAALQAAALLQSLPNLNPLQLQLLSNPELAAKMLGSGETGNANVEGASCTIYVGNLHPSITAEQLTQFPTKEQADLAQSLSGTMLGGLSIKCGPAKSPIVPVKPPPTTTPGMDFHSMAKLKAAQQRILAKVAGKVNEPSVPTSDSKATESKPAVSQSEGSRKSPNRWRTSSPQAVRDRQEDRYDDRYERQPDRRRPSDRRSRSRSGERRRLDQSRDRRTERRSRSRERPRDRRESYDRERGERERREMGDVRDRGNGSGHREDRGGRREDKYRRGIESRDGEGDAPRRSRDVDKDYIKDGDRRDRGEGKWGDGTPQRRRGGEKDEGHEGDGIHGRGETMRGDRQDGGGQRKGERSEGGKQHGEDRKGDAAGEIDGLRGCQLDEPAGKDKEANGEERGAHSGRRQGDDSRRGKGEEGGAGIEGMPDDREEKKRVEEKSHREGKGHGKERNQKEDKKRHREEKSHGEERSHREKKDHGEEKSHSEKRSRRDARSEGTLEGRREGGDVRDDSGRKDAQHDGRGDGAAEHSERRHRVDDSGRQRGSGREEHREDGPGNGGDGEKSRVREEKRNRKGGEVDRTEEDKERPGSPKPVAVESGDGSAVGRSDRGSRHGADGVGRSEDIGGDSIVASSQQNPKPPRSDPDGEAAPEGIRQKDAKKNRKSKEKSGGGGNSAKAQVDERPAAGGKKKKEMDEEVEPGEL